MSNNKNNGTINTIIGLTNNPEQYASILMEGNLNSQVDKCVCKTLHQLAGEFIQKQKVNDSPYFTHHPMLDDTENQKAVQSRLHDIQNILTNRAIAIFYLNMQNNYDFGSFLDIYENLKSISNNDYWYILQEQEWKFLLYYIRSNEISPELKIKLNKILEAFCLHLYAFLVKKDSMYREHTSIAKMKNIEDDVVQMGMEAVWAYLWRFDIDKPGNPYMNYHIIKNEINSKMNDYGEMNRNDRERRAKKSKEGLSDEKFEILAPYSLNEGIQNENGFDGAFSTYEELIEDKYGIQNLEEIENLHIIQQICNELDAPIERKVLYYKYIETGKPKNSEIARKLNIKPGKLKTILAKIEKIAEKYKLK